MKFLVTFLALILTGATGFAQSDVKFKKILNGDNAMPGTRSIFKDSEGFVWLGISDPGFIRLQGKNVRTYGAEAIADKYFKSDRATLIFEDRKKNLWLGTNAGALFRYDRALDKFDIVNDSTTSAGFSITCQVEDSNGGFWLGTAGGGLMHFDPASRKFSRYQAARDDVNTLLDNYVFGLVMDPTGKLWIGTTAGLCSLDPTNHSIQRHELKNVNANDNYRFRVIRHLLLSGNNLYISTYGGLQIFNIQTLQNVHLYNNDHDPHSLPHNSLFNAVENPDGSLWFASYGGGLIHFNPATLKFTSLKHDEFDSESISGNNLFVVYLDRDGLLWAGPADRTVSVHNTHGKKFHTLRHLPSKPDGLSDGVPMTVYEENDSIIWVGFNGSGMNRINLVNGKVKKFVNDPNNKNTISDNAVHVIRKDSKGRIWLGTSGHGLNMLDPATGKISRYESAPVNSIRGNSIADLYIDKNDTMWVITIRIGLDVFDINRNRFKAISEDSVRRVSGISFAFTARIKPWNDNVLFRTSNQVLLFDRKRKQFVKLAQWGNTFTAVGPNVRINPYDQDELLVFTRDSILSIRYADPEHIVQKAVQSRKSSNDPMGDIAIDRHHRAWFVVANQLVRWDRASGEEKSYTASDGILSGNLRSVIPGRNDRMFLTHGEGLTWFYPDELREDTTTRPVFLTGFKLYNRSIIPDKTDSLTGFSLPADISHLKEISLDHSLSFFSLEFDALEYIAPEKIHYAYKLDGFDKAWVEVGNRNFASYTNLDPGRYVFNLKCANPDGFWSRPISLVIVINPPFWQTWWFIALTITIVALIAYYIHNYRLAQSLKIERLRNKIASDLHDEVGSSLTRVSLYSDLLQNEPVGEGQKDYLTRISALSREMVSTMSDIVWSIDNQSDTAGALLIRMKDFATEVLQAKSIPFEFKITSLPENATMDPGLRQNIYMIFKEAINNIIKHASADHVSIEINNAPMFRMIIADNGKGFSAERPTRGNGLRNMEKRASAAGGTLVISHEEVGTRVTFTRTPI